MNPILPIYKKLVLSGGGPKGLALMGALHYVHEINSNIFDQIDEYWGVSIGSIISVLLIIGYTPFEIFHKFFIKMNITKNYLNMNKVYENMALCEIDQLGEIIKLLILEKMDNIPTFLQLFIKFNKKLNIIGTDVDHSKCVTFNKDTFPNMSILDALEISCDLPIIFTRKSYLGTNYVDGAISNEYPIDLADDHKTPILGIRVCSNKESIFPEKFSNINWFYKILQIPMNILHQMRISNCSEFCTNLDIEIDSISILDLTPTKEKKMELVFSFGYKKAKNYLEHNGWDIWLPI